MLINVKLYTECEWFANRALSEQQLRKDEQAQYAEWLNDFETRFHNLKKMQKEKDELLLRHEPQRAVPRQQPPVDR